MRNLFNYFSGIKMMATEIKPTIGEGIYVVKDVARILRVDYAKAYRWIVGYWGTQGGLDEDVKYTFGPIGNRAINFFSLIEFYTFFKLREKGVSSNQIKRIHNDLSRRLNTRYPFAAHDFYVEIRKRKKFVFYDYLESLIKFDEKQQFSLRFIETFLDKVEFNNNIASRYFPLEGSKNVVVDPERQFGQPIVSGTSIKTQTLFSLYNGGETLDSISELYNISIEKVRDAIAFQSAA